MKATGIIRRIDDLGKVVIPKEIRRGCNIHEGDPLEIFTANIDGKLVVCLGKYETNFIAPLTHLADTIENEMADSATNKQRGEIH